MGQTTDSLQVNFKLYFHQSPLELGQKYITNTNDTVSIATFKCYISAIEIQYADTTVFKETNSYHLLDSESPESFRIPITRQNGQPVTKVTFSVGVDSIANTSGALAGALDPVKGMYWAWQSGYINMKVEGQSSSCNTRKHQFQFHLGGYLPPFNALRRKEIVLNSKEDSNVIIKIDLASFFSNIRLAETPSVMIPGKPAMELANQSITMFSPE